MREKNKNEVVISGYLFNHTLEMKQVNKPGSAYDGVKFISGRVNIATDDELTNVVGINYGFVTETTRSGENSQIYQTLKEIIETSASVEDVGKDEALTVRAVSSFKNNIYYSQKLGTVVVQQRIEDGFITLDVKLPTDERDRSRFEVDMLIENVKYIENDMGDYLELKGLAFGYKSKNWDLPSGIQLTLQVRDKNGIDYFESLDISSKEPFFTKLWGNIYNQKIEVAGKSEVAFGTPKKEFRYLNSWQVESAQAKPYEFGEEGVITADEVKKIHQAIELNIASKQGAAAFPETRTKQATPAANTKEADDFAKYDFL